MILSTAAFSKVGPAPSPVNLSGQTAPPARKLSLLSGIQGLERESRMEAFAMIEKSESAIAASQERIEKNAQGLVNLAQQARRCEEQLYRSLKALGGRQGGN